MIQKPGQSEVFCELFINKDMLAFAEDAEKRLFWKLFYYSLSLHTQGRPSGGTGTQRPAASAAARSCPKRGRPMESRIREPKTTGRQGLSLAAGKDRDTEEKAWGRIESINL